MELGLLYGFPEKFRRGLCTKLLIKMHGNVIHVSCSTTSRVETAKRLNMSCNTEPAKARSKSSLLDMCVRATIVLVTEVPMLAPITIGIAVLTVNTEKMGKCLSEKSPYNIKMIWRNAKDAYYYVWKGTIKEFMYWEEKGRKSKGRLTSGRYHGDNDGG